MPELAEIETIRKQLEKKLIGKKIKSIDVNVAKMAQPSVAKIKKQIINKKIVRIVRRAKLLVWELSCKIDKINKTDNYNLVFHLKMSGQIILADKKSNPEKYTHIIFTFTDGSQVFFNDMRKFGWVKLVDNKELEKIFKGYGPEPLDNDFTLNKFEEMLLARKRSVIKSLLCDQKWLAGIGNIYSQEALFCAKISPMRKAESLNDVEIKNLYNCIIKILLSAIKWHGTSDSLYLDAYGKKGSFQNKLKVYGREGQKCFRCAGKIKKTKIGGRGTCYCAKCQT